MSRILVTGAAGFIGSKLATTMAVRNTVLGLTHDKLATQNDASVYWWPLDGDVCDYGRMLEIIIDQEIEYIYHLAAKSIVRNCRCDPLGCLATNVLGTANILEAARQSDNIKGIMVAESDKAYGDGITPYRENQMLCPGSIYEASKACVTHIASAYHKNYGVPVFTVRSANVYGPGDANMSRLIPGSITRLLNDEPPRITDGAEQFTREFFFIDDFVATVMALMEKKPWGHVFNVGSGDVRCIGETVDTICDLMGKDRVADKWAKPDGLMEIKNQSLCLDKLNEWLPDREITTLKEGLKETIKWWQQN